MDNNPYRSPAESPIDETAKRAAPNQMGIGRVPDRKLFLPTAFWGMWWVYTIACLGTTFLSMNATGFLREFSQPLLVASLMSLFIPIRAFLCERFQHRSMAMRGVPMFFAQWLVCFGMFYLSLGLMMLPILWLGRYNPLVSTSSDPFNAPTSNVAWAQLLGIGGAWLALFLGLLLWSAVRPKLEHAHRNENDTAPDADR